MHELTPAPANLHVPLSGRMEADLYRRFAQIVCVPDEHRTSIVYALHDGRTMESGKRPIGHRMVSSLPAGTTVQNGPTLRHGYCRPELLPYREGAESQGSPPEGHRPRRAA
jgi:hypothetical protein